MYAAAPAAWRLRAHARAADTLARHGAGPVERARHVEHAARRGERAAIDLLADAAGRVFEQAPATAARYLQSALRLLPDDADPTERIELLQQRAYALFGAGRLQAADAELAETLELLPADAREQRASLICSRAAIEVWSGQAPSEPRRRVQAAFAEEPAGPSQVGFKLRMSLAGLEFYDMRLERVAALATEALAIGSSLEDRVLEHGALGMLALAQAAGGHAEQTRASSDRVLAFLTQADDAEIGQYHLGFGDLGWALGYAGRYEEALRQLRRGVAIGHSSGHGYFIPVLLGTQLHPLIALGLIPEAIAIGEEAVEAARASGNPGLLLGTHDQLALARRLSGDRAGAERDAHEAVRLGAAHRLWRARAGWTLGVIQADTRPEAGIATMLDAAGGPELPDIVPAERPLVWAALADAALQAADVAVAEQAAARLDAAADATAIPLAHALAARTRAALLLAGERPAEAAATAARGAAIGAAPLEAARARAIEGVALARAGDRSRGAAVLKQVAGDFDRFGANRLRDDAARELRRLGVRTWRRGPTAPRDAEGVGSLSPREREVAALVLAGKRNTEIAQELVLSVKTIESHTRNIYAKLGVSSRVEFVTHLRQRDRDQVERPTAAAALDPGGVKPASGGQRF